MTWVPLAAGAAFLVFLRRGRRTTGAPSRGLGQRPPTLQSAQVSTWGRFLAGGRWMRARLQMAPVLGQFCPCAATPRRVSYRGTSDPTNMLFVTSVRRRGGGTTFQLLPLAAAEAGGILILSQASGSFPLREDAGEVTSESTIEIILENRNPSGQIELPQLSVDFEVGVAAPPRAAVPRRAAPPGFTGLFRGRTAR
jgi:hypothetical protein